MPSSYESVQTSWDAGAAPEASPQAMSGLKPAGDPTAPAPGDAWAQVQYLAEKTANTCALERDMAAVFEKRSTVSRRMADAHRRRDNVMASQAANDWIRSEVQLHKLFEAYAAYINERNQLVEGLLADEQNRSPALVRR